MNSRKSFHREVKMMIAGGFTCQRYGFNVGADKFSLLTIENGKNKHYAPIGMDIDFPKPKISLRQAASGGRIYLYIKDSVLNKQTVQSIRLEVIRENHGEMKRYRYSYSDSEKSAERFRRSDYQCLAFPPVKLHVDYNHIKFAISGIELPEPGSDAEILLVFSGIKRRVIIWTYLFKGVVSLAGWLLVISIYAFVKRKVRKK